MVLWWTDWYRCRSWLALAIHFLPLINKAQCFLQLKAMSTSIYVRLKKASFRAATAKSLPTFFRPSPKKVFNKLEKPQPDKTMQNKLKNLDDNFHLFNASQWKYSLLLLFHVSLGTSGFVSMNGFTRTAYTLIMIRFFLLPMLQPSSV